MPAGAITLFHVRGIRVGVDYSWFVVLFLIIIWLSSFYRDVLGAGQGGSAPYALAVASALLFFGSILLHEFGHALAARRSGIAVSGITLWMFGGFTRMDRGADSPATELRIAIAGPAVTALIVVVCTGVGILLAGPSEFKDAALTEGSTDVAAGAALIGWLAGINLLVLVFNLVPAFPLDGGRIALALAWWRTGSRATGTRIAATLGQGFGLLLILVGVGYFFVYLGDLVGGLMFAFLGLILRGAARGAIVQTELSSRIEGVSVADVMDREPVAIPEGLTIERALDEYFLRYRWAWFPVIDATQRFIGLLDRNTAEEVPAVERASATVSDVLARDEGTLAVSEDAPLEAVLGRQGLRRLGALVAVDDEGRLRGVITADAIGRVLRPPTAGTS
jgi:Zn-dependent protease/CBS domain-containing protein